MKLAPLKFPPNIRFEKAGSTTGFTWGKPAKISNILKNLPTELQISFSIADNDIVAERWMCTDDRGNPSVVEGENQPEMKYENYLERQKYGWMSIRFQLL